MSKEDIDAFWDPSGRYRLQSEMASVEDLNREKSRSVKLRPSWAADAEGESLQGEDFDAEGESLQREESATRKASDGVAPCLLVRRKPLGDIKSVSSGWDLVVPQAWTRHLWLALIHAGARAAGCETRLIQALSVGDGYGSFPVGYPDSKAGEREESRQGEEDALTWKRKPKGKRAPGAEGRPEPTFEWDWDRLSGGRPWRVVRGLRATELFDRIRQGEGLEEDDDEGLLMVRIEMVEGGIPTTGTFFNPLTLEDNEHNLSMYILYMYMICICICTCRWTQTTMNST